MRQQIVGLLEELNSVNNGYFVETDINDYVDKILKKAVLIEVDKSGILVGFIAYYANDIASETAYLTMLAVKPLYQNEGYGKHLLDLSIKDIRDKGFVKYGLEVLKNNFQAFKFYENQGFKTIKSRGDFLYMEKPL
ncbi:N-acetyltransferase [Yeosuana sp. MJ-SS3]|uniref:N-acetyltransferase n=1 Tax=Gilvirhabdus luticola TaxID=3079858 RepID=A0ABU3U500_9FLAO|nr:N-acetyltransferase [Yeosuana sp. MJ-SS3]MDU8885483.1 N-acetyltransferase [Yeosuana sp. MJ-SS3]